MTRPMRPHALLLAAVAGLAAGCARTRPFEKPTGPHVRVLTYNVNWGGPGAAASGEAVRAAEADVVCLQETTPSWEPALRRALAASHPHVLSRHAGGAGGQAVFSKWPVAETAWHRPPGAFFHGWFLRAETPLGPLQLLAVHLRPPCDDEGRFGVGPYFATKKLRLREMQALAGRLEAGAPTLVLGDFKEQDRGPALKWLVRRGYTDALREFDRGTKTWRWQTSTLTLRARLDHIFYSKALHALEARVIPKGGSDHFPLLGVFERATPGPRE